MRNTQETEDISGAGEENSHRGPEARRQRVHSSEGSARLRVRGRQRVSKTSQTSQQDQGGRLHRSQTSEPDRGGLRRSQTAEQDRGGPHWSQMSEQDCGEGLHCHESSFRTC